MRWLALFLALLAPVAAWAQWSQTIPVTATDPNGALATSHEFQWRINGGAWSATQAETAPSTQFTLTVDHGDLIEIQGRPCADGLCAAWVQGAVTVPPQIQPYTSIIITVPTWSKP